MGIYRALSLMCQDGRNFLKMATEESKRHEEDEKKILETYQNVLLQMSNLETKFRHREKLHQQEIKEIIKIEDDKKDPLKWQIVRLKWNNQALRKKENDGLIQLEELNENCNRLRQERDNAIKRVQELQNQEELVPSHFICPILQEIMNDPCIAADGFTYEGEAIKRWFNTGHYTSPMTNLVLPRRDLIPNRVLRSVIQEWLEQRKS